MLGNYLQQTTSADDIFRCIFSWHFKGLNTGWILTKLGRFGPYMALFNICLNSSSPLHIKVTFCKMKSSKIVSSETTRRLIFGIQHYLVDLCQICSNHGPGGMIPHRPKCDVWASPNISIWIFGVLS